MGQARRASLARGQDLAAPGGKPSLVGSAAGPPHGQLRHLLAGGVRDGAGVVKDEDAGGRRAMVSTSVSGACLDPGGQRQHLQGDVAARDVVATLEGRGGGSVAAAGDTTRDLSGEEGQRSSSTSVCASMKAPPPGPAALQQGLQGAAEVGGPVVFLEVVDVLQGAAPRRLALVQGGSVGVDGRASSPFVDRFAAKGASEHQIDPSHACAHRHLGTTTAEGGLGAHRGVRSPGRGASEASFGWA